MTGDEPKIEEVDEETSGPVRGVEVSGNRFEEGGGERGSRICACSFDFQYVAEKEKEKEEKKKKTKTLGG